MVIQKLLISTFLMASLMTNPASPERTSSYGASVQNPAADQINKTLLEQNQAFLGFSLIQNDSVLAVNSPLTPKTYKPKKVYAVAATGYSSTPEETDHTPFITASGTHVREGVIAANFLPLGTIIKIPELFGDKTFVVEDRMASRYWFNIDIWFPKKELAKEFGVKVVEIEIVS